MFNEMYPQENDPYTSSISQILRIAEVTWGEPKQGFIVRYRGSLINQDSAAAYDELVRLLHPQEVTPLFRMEEGQHAIILVKGIVRPRPSKTWVNGVLFLLTVVTVLMAGALYSYNGPMPESISELLLGLLNNLGDGVAFAVTLLAILVTHEFGHYLAGRYHKTTVTLPYFIPFPLSVFGTMGAFIQLKEPPKNRRILLDIGIAGPLAGLVVAIPLLLLGLYLSPVEKLPFDLTSGQGFEGNSILYLGLKYLVKGEMLPQPFNYFGVNPVVYWIKYYLTGTPLPGGGRDVILHPIAWAGWAGLLVTAINLIPAGQLDGGHVAYVLFGRKAGKILPFILGALLLLGFVWSGWWLWVILLLVLGRLYAEPLDQITTLDSRRRWLAILGLVIFALVFVPVPMF
jgi:membrane-associated protease RseP (regulator of RpoE activity)